MFISSLELRDFRNYTSIFFNPIPEGIVAIIGNNGQGKTSLLEALGYLSTKNSFRGASKDVMIRYGQNESIIRGEFTSSTGRDLLIEASMSKLRADKFLINKQPQVRTSSLNHVIPITIFSAQDIEVVRGAPALRRGFLDSGVSMIFPKGDSIITSLDKVLRQRTTLLKQSGGKPTSEIISTLDVWDQQLSHYGNQLVELREQLVDLIMPYFRKAYRDISGSGDEVSLSYFRSWQGDLFKELQNNRNEDLKRQINTIGPHRDDLEINLNNHLARHAGSQGEQRTSAYSLKVALHTLYREISQEDPILLLDDVFSELDEQRCKSLIGSICATQTFITTTGKIPEINRPTSRIFVHQGAFVASL